MIVHNVAFKIAAEDPATKAEHAAELARRILALDGRIPGLIGMEIGHDVGRVDGHFDLVLVSRHETYADLEAYQAHPLHLTVIEYSSQVVAQRAAVDYEV